MKSPNHQPIRILLAVATSLTLSMCASAQSSISTYEYWDGSSYVWPYGGYSSLWGGSYIYGQAITVGSDNILTDWTFWTSEGEYGGGVTSIAKVFEWDSTNKKTVGSALFTSGVNILGTTAEFLPTTIYTGNLNLVSGHEYVLLFQADGDERAHAKFGGWDSNVKEYTSMEWVNPPSLISDSWTTFDNFDLVFKANFISSTPTNNAVPEPSEWAAMGLLGTGLLGLVVRGRKKKLAN